MMSRHARKSTKKPASKTKSVPSEPILNRLLRWILELPRFVRFLVVGIFALAVTIAASPLVDNIYLRYLFNEQTVVLPSLVSVGLGVIMYLLGWWLIVGTVGETAPTRKAVLWYVGIGMLSVFLVIILIINGYSSATASMP
ncbi:MAG: hypothetical protein K8L97_02915 [Anaerolineae bacterium]|nr:hypothetical protein [Anaerolineae bacterium]